ASFVRSVGKQREKAPSPANGTPFSNWRRFLLETGFLDSEENELLVYAYSLTSAKGSHHGVTDEAWARLARRIVFCATQYLLQRHETGKNNPQHKPAARPAPQQAAKTPPDSPAPRSRTWLRWPPWRKTAAKP